MKKLLKKTMKLDLETILKYILLALIYLTGFFIVFLILNRSCNNCIIEDPNVLFNPQGYAFSHTNNKVDDFDEQAIKQNEETTKPSKVRFNKGKTTGFMTIVQENPDINPRACS